MQGTTATVSHLVFTTIYFLTTAIGAVIVGFSGLAAIVGWALAIMAGMHFLTGIWYSWALTLTAEERKSVQEDLSDE